MKRKYQVKYEILNNSGEWQDITNLVIGTTEIRLGNTNGLGSDSFGVDNLKKFADITTHCDINKALTVQPTLVGNPFQPSRRIRIKVRTVESMQSYNYDLPGNSEDYLFIRNLKRVHSIKAIAINDGDKDLTPDEANFEIKSMSTIGNGIYIYFNRILQGYEKLNLLIEVIASDLDSDRVEIEGADRDEYFVPNVDPDVIEILGYYKYFFVPWAKGYLSRLYFSDKYGVEYLYFSKENDPLTFPYEILQVIKEGNGIRIKFNKPIPKRTRMVIGLLFNSKEDVVIFDGYIDDYTMNEYHQVNYTCQDLSWKMDVMAINKTYPKNTTYINTIKAILQDNKQTDFEFIHGVETPDNTATLLEDYKVENVTIWEAIQKLAISKGWALYFKYDRSKNKQVLAFEDIVNVNYITYQLNRYDLVGGLQASGGLSEVRNIVEVIYKDKELNQEKKVEVRSQSSIDLYQRENRLTLGLDVTKDTITTHERALNLANMALDDLKDPQVSYSIETTLMPKLKLNDELWFIHPNITEQPLHLRAHSIVHRISVENDGTMECTTSILGGGKISYKRNNWLYIDSKIKDDTIIIIK
ncbi:MAG: hypothetical protein ACRCTZ_03860 [Sarcina sp.]